MSPKTIFEMLKETYSEWSEDKASRLAAALAYYTVFSLAPLVIIVLAILGFFFSGNRVEEFLIEQFGGLIGPEGAEITGQIIENANQPSSSLVAGLIGVATLLFGATGVFAQLQDSLNTIWEVTPNPDRGIMGMIKDRFLSFTMILGIGFLLLVSLLLSAMLAALNEFITGLLPEAVILGQVMNFVVSFGLITLLFAMIYKILPDVEIAWSDVWIGAAVTALLFSVGKFLLGFYLGNQSFGSTYGAAGSILILLLWVYYSAQILLFGAEFTQVYARRFGSRIKPSENAIPLEPEARVKQGIPHTQQVEEASQRQEAKKQNTGQPAPGLVETIPGYIEPAPGHSAKWPASQKSQLGKTANNGYSARLISLLIIGVIVGTIRNLIK
jgi:membrane protein